MTKFSGRRGGGRAGIRLIRPPMFATLLVLCMLAAVGELLYAILARLL